MIVREILFKGKTEDGEWVEGSLFVYNKDNYLIITKEDADWSYVSSGVYDGSITEVQKDTICQFTGLTDKNGNKIWENDVVHLFGKDTLGNYDWKAVVEFGNPNGLYSWGYQLKPIGYFAYNTDILCWVGMEEANIYCEVISNIFDNPELLKGE